MFKRIFDSLSSAAASRTKVIRKTTTKLYKNGELVREISLLEDGGLGQEAAEERLKDVDRIAERAEAHLKRIMEEMDKMFD